MPLLPLPPNAPIGGGDLPVTSTPDVAKQEADFVKAPLTAFARDAVRSAVTQMTLEYQRCAERAAAQLDTRRATGVFLDGLGADKRIFHQFDEAQESYRSRILAAPAVVTPQAIVAAANAILAPYTSIKCKYLESILDACYMNDGNAGVKWDCFMSSRGDSTHIAYNLTPHYPDRLYVDDATENGGASISDRDPGGAWMFSDSYGRYLVLRVPDITAIDDDVAYMTDGTFDDNAWMTDGTASDPLQSFMGTKLSTEIYQSIVNTIERMVGGSIRWMLYVDPTLTSTT